MRAPPAPHADPSLGRFQPGAGFLPPMTKTYRLTKSFCIFNLLPLGLFTVAPVVAILVVLHSSIPRGQAPPAWAFVPWLLLCVGLWYFFVLRIPFEITVRDDKSVEFRSLIKRTVVYAHEIRSIKVGLDTRFVKVKHEGGSLRLANHIDGFYDFIWTLKSFNPSIEVKGC